MLESKKSMIGRINDEQIKQADIRANEGLKNLGTENNIGSSFFTFDET